MIELFEYILIALACPLVLPLVEPQESEDKVIYARLNVMPKMKNSEDAFHVGRMVGQMQRQLEIELSLEVEPQKSEVRNETI